jgi:hypothetical protein
MLVETAEGKLTRGTGLFFSLRSKNGLGEGFTKKAISLLPQGVVFSLVRKLRRAWLTPK